MGRGDRAGPLSHGLDQDLRFGRGGGSELLLQSAGEFIIGREGGGAVSQVVEKTDESHQLDLALGGEPRGPARHRRRLGAVAGCAVLRRHRPCSRRGAVAQTASLLLDPLLELGGPFGDEQAFEEVSAIEGEGVGWRSGVAGILERSRVAAQGCGVDPDLFFPTRGEDAVADLAP